MASSEAVPGTPDGSVHSSTLHKEGPVLCFINKRLRALKKKYSRILQIEENKSKGKTINKEQEDVLQSKIGVVALIEEFEKLKQPLSIAVKEELAERERELMGRDEDGSSANEKENSSADEKENIFANEKENSSANEKENSSANGETIENEEPDRKDVPLNECSENASKASEEGFIANEQSPDSLAELLKFIYFAQLFHLTSHEDFASMTWTKMHERISCLSYDYVTEDATDHLKEEDLDALSILGSLLTSRPSNLTLSHKDALLNCVHHAQQWLRNSDQPMHPNIPISYSSLREKLNRITSSEYFVMTPELKIFSQQTADAVTQNVPNVMLHEFPTEDGVLRMEGGPNYFQHQVAETRFASHTIVLRRLVKVRQALMRMVTSNLWSIWRQSNTERAQKVKSMILDDPWWDRVGYLLSFIEPIMSMIRFTDMDRPCLGEIYDGIDSMIEKIKAVINAKEQDPEETFFKQVQSILIERWNKMTTPLHLLAFALTPRFYSTEILSLPGRVAPYRDVEVSEGYMAALARLFPDPEAQDIVMVEFGNFIAETGHSLAALRNKYKMDAHMWWYLHGHASVYLQPLAIKVLAQNQTETEQQNYQDEESCNAVGSSELLNTGGDGNTSFRHVGERNSSSEILQNEGNRIHTSPFPDLKQDESYNKQLHSLPQLSQLNEQYDEKQLPQQQNSGQQPQQRQRSQQQYYARNGGMLRSNQRQRGGRSMGYAGGGQGRGYMNGRGNRGGRVSYSDAYGQYYDQGTQPHRNYYSRRGQGGRGVGLTQENAFQE